MSQNQRGYFADFFFKEWWYIENSEEKKKNTPVFASVPCSFSLNRSSPSTRPSLDHFSFWEILVDHVHTVLPGEAPSSHRGICSKSAPPRFPLPISTWILFQLNAKSSPTLFSTANVLGVVVKENWKRFCPSDFHDVLYVRKWKLRARKNEPAFLWNHRRFYFLYYRWRFHC